MSWEGRALVASTTVIDIQRPPIYSVARRSRVDASNTRTQAGKGMEAVTASTIPLEHIACPLCSATGYRVRYQIPDLALDRPGIFTLVECAGCGLLYQNPRPSLRDIGTFYPPDYEPFGLTPPWAESRRLRQVLHLYGLKKRWGVVERFAPSRERHRAILDVGCATGLFLAAGSDDWRKVGVELSTYAARYARSQFGLTVYEGTLEDAPLEGPLFDVITMWDVLEHLHDPLASLRRARALLHPDGILVARVPNRDALEVCCFGDAWAGFDQPRHMVVPDPLRIRLLLERAGFQVTALPPMGGSYGVIVLSWTFWLKKHVREERRRRLARRALDNLPMRLALLPAIWLIEHLLGRGSSITVVAQPTGGAC